MVGHVLLTLIADQTSRMLALMQPEGKRCRAETLTILLLPYRYPYCLGTK